MERPNSGDDELDELLDSKLFLCVYITFSECFICSQSHACLVSLVAFDMSLAKKG